MLILIPIFVILLLVIGIILIDLTPIMSDWFKRIHIGKFSNYSAWNEKITIKAIKWLNHTPKIKVTDNTRLIFIDILRGNYSKSSIQHWQEAALILGLIEYMKNSKENHIEKEMTNFLNNKFDKNGQWKQKPIHVDVGILAYAIMKMDFIEVNRYKQALNYTWDLIKEHIGSDGTVGYRKSMQSYRYVDTIGFICPFLVAYGKKYNKPECIELAINQIQEYVKFGMLDEHFIPCHAYQVENKLPLGIYGWGRGIGWLSIGLIDTWNELSNHSSYKNDLEKIIIKLAKSVIFFQQSNGSWNWTVIREETRSDSSTTAILAWFLLNSSKIKEINKECLESTNRATNYLMSVTRKDGSIDFSQGDTKDIGVYSQLYNILPFTQGFCIRTVNAQSNIRS
ncbi:glycoside hydrolase family 88 protein [Bacillus sp. AGMB 02131]|uniref:Glycoside hydrolase family 88 protein n=1 Tax=Peribacillus faecalis TaxID=2772559 RepID=A0A927HA88_9BACI|nr:glycoside hydrolase family 88 protein [Peribacillus faecalis]MBD3107679.1 glycoside hydrolase family 88 protein [Peribacillus faecalis]